MVFQPSKLGRIAVAEQSDWISAGGSAASTTATTAVCEAEISYPSQTQAALSTDAIAGVFRSPRISAGALAGTFSLTMPIHAWSSATPSAAPAAGNLFPDAMFLKHVLGGVSYSGFSPDTDSITGGTTSVLTMDGADTAVMLPGQAILVPLASGHSVGWIQSVDETASPDNVTLTAQLSAVPASTGQVYGSISTFMNTTTNAPLTVTWQANNANSQIRMEDCVVTSATIAATPKEQPKLTVELQAKSWTNVGSGGAPGQYAFPLPQLPALIGNNNARLTVSNTATNVSTFEIAITNDVAEVLSHASTEGVAQFVTTNRAVTCSFTAPAETLATMAPGTARILQLDLANVPGQSFSCIIPGAILQESSSIGDSEGLISESFVYASGGYTSDENSDNAGNSLARVAWL